jgi:hypothetical protein
MTGKSGVPIEPHADSLTLWVEQFGILRRPAPEPVKGIAGGNLRQGK